MLTSSSGAPTRACKISSAVTLVVCLALGALLTYLL